MLDKYKDAGKLKPYLIFGMCDETFSIIYSTKPPQDVDPHWFNFFITLLNHSYWVLGSVLGALLVSMFSLIRRAGFCFNCSFCGDISGPLENSANRQPALIGVLCSVICLLVFGPSNFIIPSMIGIIAVTITRKNYVREKELAEEGV